MVRINLLPVKVSKKKEAGKQQLVLFLVVLLGGIVGNWMYHESRASALADVKRRLAKTNADIATLDKIIGQVREITAQQEQLKKKLATLDTLKRGRSGPVRMLDELSGLTPRRLWLQSVIEKKSSMTIQGSAVTIDDVSQFITALKGSTYFGDVDLKRTQAKAGGAGSQAHLVDFIIDVTARYSGSPKAEAPAAKGKG